TRPADARDAPAAIPPAAQESDASVGSDFGKRGEGGTDDTGQLRSTYPMCAMRKGRCRRRSPMTDEKEPWDEVAITELDQRYASLRLAAPDGLARVRASIERMGILSPVLVATAIEATRIVVVDGHKRVRIAMDRGDAMIWVRRAALDAADAKVAMMAANA